MPQLDFDEVKVWGLKEKREPPLRPTPGWMMEHGDERLVRLDGPTAVEFRTRCPRCWSVVDGFIAMAAASGAGVPLEIYEVGGFSGRCEGCKAWTVLRRVRGSLWRWCGHGEPKEFSRVTTTYQPRRGITMLRGR